MCHQTHGDCTFCVEGGRKGCGSHVPRQPAGEGPTVSAALLHVIPVPTRKFSHMNVDLVGHLLASSVGHVYLLSIIKRSTRWVKAVPLRNIEASKCIDWVAQPQPQLTEVHSSHLPCGLVPARAWALSMCSPLITTLRATLSAYTGRSRMPYVQ
jgi:hypothetical protein